MLQRSIVPGRDRIQDVRGEVLIGSRQGARVGDAVDISAFTEPSPGVVSFFSRLVPSKDEESMIELI
jgi:hypothetical protein